MIGHTIVAKGHCREEPALGLPDSGMCRGGVSRELVRTCQVVDASIQGGGAIIGRPLGVTLHAPRQLETAAATQTTTGEVIAAPPRRIGREDKAYSWSEQECPKMFPQAALSRGSMSSAAGRLTASAAVRMM